jgi:hypothetical protein
MRILPRTNVAFTSFRISTITASFVIVIAFLVAILPLGARASTTQLTCSPSTLRFGDVVLGKTEPQVVILTNSGQTTVTVSAVSLSGTEFSLSKLSLPFAVPAGQSVAVGIAFAPNAAAYTSGKVTITSDASNTSLKVPLAGTGVTSGALNPSPSALSFGQVAVGTTSNQSVVLTNAQPWDVTLTTFQVLGTGFSVSGPTLPVVLGVGKSVTLKVTFAPETTGVAGGSVFIGGAALSLPLSGSGTGSVVGSLSISPSSLSFGSVLVGSSGTQAASLTATGGSVTISSASSSSSQFAMPGVSLPLTIAAGQSVSVNVVFTPQSNGVSSGSVAFLSNATNSTDSEAMSGTGTTPAVSLSWNPSTSQISGYNVYRRTSTGSYSKINSSLMGNTFFSDTTVALGQTYEYATTAVNSSGEESVYSNQVQVVVP